MTDDQGPVPFGLAIADLLAGSAIVQGVLAALVRRGRTGEGAHIETSLLEALVDFQFEVLTTYLNDGGRMPTRSAFRNAHAYLAAPYGVYATRDGWIAIAMTPLDKLAAALELPSIALPAKAGFEKRDDIKRMIADHVATQPDGALASARCSRSTSGAPRSSTGRACSKARRSAG